MLPYITASTAYITHIEFIEYFVKYIVLYLAWNR